jgi:Protein of unknown function (DUF1761)
MEMHINWLAYAAAVAAQMVIGYLWFHPAVLGRTWAKANGQSYEDMMKSQNMGITLGVTIVLTLLFTFWLNLNVTGAGQEDPRFYTFQHGIGHAVALTLFVMLPVFGTPGMFEKRGWGWVLLHTGYWFCRMVVAAGILSLWR